MLLNSETHYTSKSYLKFPSYTVYHTNHPDGTPHRGTAIIIKNNIKHHENVHFQTEYLQATTMPKHISCLLSSKAQNQM